MSSLLIVGCGFIGRRLARHYLDQGDRVIGVVRSQESAASLEAEGIEALVLDLSRELHPEELDRLPMAARDGGHVGNAGAVLDKAARDGGHVGNAGAVLDKAARDGGHVGNAGAVLDKASRDGGHVGNAGAVPDLAGARVFHLAPPPENGVIDLHTRHLIAGFAQAGHPFRIVYVSTTGVYGNCGGDWVDEDRPVHPQEDRAHRRWDAEQALERWRQDSGGALVTLRVAGMYGPGRLPLERIRAGLPLVRPEDAPWSNRIHADDLVTACIAAMGRGADGAVYNVCDGHPSTMTDYFFQIADAFGLPRPPTITMDEAEGRLSAGMLSYMRESRRLSNRRLVEDLGVRLRYPTLAQGLPTCR